MPAPTAPAIHATAAASRRRRAHREDGQVIVLFAGAILVLLALCAVVVDVAWYWTNNLRIQRAADAAALAGVVWLPGNPSQAFSVARAEAAKNGYANGVGGVVITPSVDPANNRRLRVRITSPVGTFFARVVGVTSWPAARESRADYVLPVPMGSPSNYYGVGFYEGNVPSTANAPGSSGWKTPTAAPAGGRWTASSGSIQNTVRTDDNIYAQETTNGDQQQWSTFGLGVPVPGTGQVLTVSGIEVQLTDAFLSAACGTSTIGVQLSWNAGTTWSTAVPTPALGTNTSTGDYTLGSAASTGAWGTHTWVASDFSDTNFRIRLTANKGCPTAATSINLDMLQVRVSWNMATTTWALTTLDVTDPLTGSALASQGFWGAIFTSGGWRENGDKYAPSIIGNGTAAAATSASPTYDAAGYDYTLELPGGSGDVRLFDPMFCATGSNGHGGSFGAGDHWTSPNTINPVAITYRLYDTHGTLTDISDDGAPVATLNYDPGSATYGDFSGVFGTPDNSTSANRADCSTNAAHNRWVQMAAGLASGTYRLNVNTSLAGSNLSVGAENLFSIWVKSSGAARVYGAGRMAAYTNLAGGVQQFYIAQIERQHAGKTMEIRLFDPGEASGNAYLRILSPDGNSYHRQQFSWTSDDGRSGNNVYQIQTSVNGAAQFNNREITITIPLPATYGASGLNPPGDITDEDGWWQIEYEVNQGNDTTTWSVNIRGNPVHLVTP